ncbi:MAG: sialidase family protein [Candidatus Thiodiazotropha sp. DIVDIV]
MLNQNINSLTLVRWDAVLRLPVTATLCSNKMKTLLITLSLLLFMSACGSDSSSVASPSPEQVTFTGSGDLGIFDPSITRDPDTGKLWMSYSSVETSALYDPSLYWAVSIRLASSNDNGTTWQSEGLVADNVETTFGAITVHEGSIAADDQGIWQSETSSLIYDPSANLGEEWKLIWFQYMHANSISYFASYSWIAMKTAATPEGLAAATTVKLFGGAGLSSDNNITGTPVFSPVAGLPAIQLNSELTNTAVGAALSDLNLCVFAEPGLHATNSAVYLAIFCADATTMPITEYLVYFRCASPCNMINAASWEYLGRLLTPADAQAATGDDHFQAPALVEKNAKTYLIVTPVDTTSGNRYNGCRVYEFSDVNSNQLRRNLGQLVEVTRVDGSTGTHNGACTAYSGLSGDILLSQFEAASTTETFKVYKSQVSLP